VVLGYGEGFKPFGDIREMTREAKKFDEPKDTIMKALPDDKKEQVKKRLGEDGGGGRYDEAPI